MLSDSVLKQRNSKFGCILSCCFSCSFCTFLGPLQKKGVKPVHCQNKIKHVKGECCVNPCLFVPSVSNVPSVVSKQNVRGKTTKVLASLANHGYESSGSLYPQGGLQ